MRFRAETRRSRAKDADVARKTTLYGWRSCGAAIVVALIVSSCSGGAVFKQYEYEEEVYLSLDGSATMYVNSSVAALNALRGTSFDTNPRARVDRDAIRAYYTSPNTDVTWVRSSRRNNRRFLHVRLEVNDVRKLDEAAPFAWSTYGFAQDGNLFVYKQAIDGAAGKDVGSVGWTGSEIVAFRLHLPSKIEYHNTLTANYKRGNILVWEQPLTDRLRGRPLALEARIQTQSILYRTVWLFGATFLAVAIGFALVIWWVMRRGAPPPPVGQV
jgi:hypothetical protein